MDPFPELLTTRLRLRKLQLEDVPTIVAFCNNRKITDNVIHLPFPYKEEDAIFWLNMANEGYKNKTRYTFAIAQRASNALVGAIGLTVDPGHNKAEMGYWVGEPFWNKGIATEAVKALLRFGFETLALNKIYATHFLRNPASARVMLNNGMIKEGDLAGHYQKGEEYLDVAQYRLMRKEFIASQGKQPDADQ